MDVDSRAAYNSENRKQPKYLTREDYQQIIVFHAKILRRRKHKVSLCSLT